MMTKNIQLHLSQMNAMNKPSSNSQVNLMALANQTPVSAQDSLYRTLKNNQNPNQIQGLKNKTSILDHVQSLH
jgi:DNA-binding phage protein